MWKQSIDWIKLIVCVYTGACEENSYTVYESRMGFCIRTDQLTVHIY